MSEHKWAAEVQHAVLHGTNTIEFRTNAGAWCLLEPNRGLRIFDSQILNFRIHDPYRGIKEARAAGKDVEVFVQAERAWNRVDPSATLVYFLPVNYYRVKTEVLRYRIALCENSAGRKYLVMVQGGQPEPTGLVSWATDWQGVEI